MSNAKKRIAELQMLLSHLDLAMGVFGENASADQKQRGEKLKADIQRNIAELEKEGAAASDAPKPETAKPEKASHDHKRGQREAGDLRNPKDIINAITEVVDEMTEHHKGSEPVGFIFVLAHQDPDNADNLIIHGAGGGDTDVLADVLMEKAIKLKMGIGVE